MRFSHELGNYSPTFFDNEKGYLEPLIMPIPVSANAVYAIKPASTQATNLKTASPMPPASAARGPLASSRDAFASQIRAPQVPLPSQNKASPVLDVKSGGGGRAGGVIGNSW